LTKRWPSLSSSWQVRLSVGKAVLSARLEFAAVALWRKADGRRLGGWSLRRGLPVAEVSLVVVAVDDHRPFAVELAPGPLVDLLERDVDRPDDVLLTEFLGGQDLDQPWLTGLSVPLSAAAAPLIGGGKLALLARGLLSLAVLTPAPDRLGAASH
jgi:hypothetical protein